MASFFEMQQLDQASMTSFSTPTATSPVYKDSRYIKEANEVEGKKEKKKKYLNIIYSSYHSKERHLL